MYDVVQHAAETLQLAEDDILLIVQPTQPFRRPEHLTRAVQLLRETGADSVVSVVPLPLTHSPDMLAAIVGDGYLSAWNNMGWPTRRQDADQAYQRDGTVYALWVKTLRSGTIYGRRVKALILEPSESCELDTEDDWKAVEARWEREHGR
jgi:CMP-N,N'-diacetyllegionaminic acid synthase